MAEGNTYEPAERDVLELVREGIQQDKKREIEYTDLLKDYIEFLKDEIYVKNKKLDKYCNMFRENQVVETRLVAGNPIDDDQIDEVQLKMNYATNSTLNASQSSQIDNHLNDDNSKSIDGCHFDDAIYENHEDDDVNPPIKRPISNEWVTERRKKKRVNCNEVRQPIISTNNFDLLREETTETVNGDLSNKEVTSTEICKVIQPITKLVFI